MATAHGANGSGIMKKGLHVILVVVIVLNASCRKKDVAHETSGEYERELTPAKARLLDSLNPTSFLVENGQAAVIKIPDGYLFVIPRKEDFEVGDYKILFSASGNFRKDGTVVVAGGGALYSMFVNVRGCHIDFSGGSHTAVYVRLSPFDETASIAKYHSCDPNSLDANTLEFKSNPGFDRGAFDEVVGTELKRIFEKKE